MKNVEINVDAVRSRLSSIVNTIDKSDLSDNSTKLQLFSAIEILRLDIENLTLNKLISESESEALICLIDSKVRLLELSILPRPKDFLSQVDALFSCVAASFAVLILGSVGGFVVIIPRALDALFPGTSNVVKMQKFIGYTFLSLFGVRLEIEGITDRTFNSNCAILAFSHSSNFDTFFILASSPIRLFALAKKELFMIPFFSWSALALGGVPIDRQNRDRAVTALKRVVEQSKSINLAVAASPEGTRTLTGLLLPFKKGPFHMWEDMKSPIVPVVSFGAFELWPGSKLLNTTGVIHARYLAPIMPHEASNRHDMQILVRRRMLEALANPPLIPQLTLFDKVYFIFCRMAVVSVAFASLFGLLVLIKSFNMPVSRVIGYTCLVSVIITILLYVYSVYIVNVLYNQKYKKAA